jgi:hypothetical protein
MTAIKMGPFTVDSASSDQEAVKKAQESVGLFPLSVEKEMGTEKKFVAQVWRKGDKVFTMWY